MTAEAAIELEVWCLEAERQEKFDQVEAVTEAGAEWRLLHKQFAISKRARAIRVKYGS